jgi:hypothetical protein
MFRFVRAGVRIIRNKISRKRFQCNHSANIRIDDIPKSLFEWGGEGAYAESLTWTDLRGEPESSRNECRVRGVAAPLS